VPNKLFISTKSGQSFNPTNQGSDKKQKPTPSRYSTMEKLTSAFKSMSFIEIVLMLSVFMGLMVHYWFGFQSSFFILIFSFALAFVYFPFGFYFIKRPSENYSNNISIILGFVYALGILAILLGVVNMDSYHYPLIADFSILVALIIYLLFQLRSSKYPDTYINTQFLRVAYLMVCTFIVLVK